MGFGDSIGTLLDRPGFDWKTLVIGFSTAHFLFESYLKLRQLKTVKENKPIPKLLQAEIDSETVKKSCNYATAKLKFSLATDLSSLVQNILFFKFDVLPWLWSSAGSLMLKLPKFLLGSAGIGGPILQSLVFLGEFVCITTILGLPVDYYSHFVLEEKFGFNKLTIPMWISDNLKSLALVAVLGAPIMAAFLKIIDYFGDKFIR
ncbi:unnamed protein product [Ambrosiozyma monospora]|uniref:Unnamed protein product n=1 Tax=Ambrosiozyma monospora TaxID=43982 RepID=A0A9W7DHG0_AMBMO|nr:unnamed protein product [Ambrosiozyma monospora]